MKKTFLYLALSVVVVAFLAGCGKPPTQEMQDTKAAIDALKQEGLGKYSPEDQKKIDDALTAAMNEVNAQDKKTFKNYDNAKKMLADVKQQAQTLKTELPAKKEAAKQNALSAQDAAKAAVGEAKSLLAKAPKGKGTAADIEALKGDVKGLEDSLVEAQGLIDKEEYGTAVNKANAVKDQAAGVKDQITQAMEKVKGAKAAKTEKPAKK